MPKIDVAAIPERSGTRYPAPHDEPVKRRRWRALGDAAGLTQVGVNFVTLDPGVWSSQRHWHTHEDELVYVLSGELVLVTDAGEETMRPGDCAGFRAGSTDGHHFVNRSEAPATFLAIGTRDPRDEGEYSDIDMRFNAETSGKPSYTRKDGSPFD